MCVYMSSSCSGCCRLPWVDDTNTSSWLFSPASLQLYVYIMYYVHHVCTSVLVTAPLVREKTFHFFCVFRFSSKFLHSMAFFLFLLSVQLRHTQQQISYSVRRHNLPASHWVSPPASIQQHVSFPAPRPTSPPIFTTSRPASPVHTPSSSKLRERQLV